MPGSGKGTQGAILGTVPGFRHVSTGDIFRSLDRESELGRLFVAHSTRGELVPDDVTIRIFGQHMRDMVGSGRFVPQRQIALLDGVPRSVRQATLLRDQIDVLMVLHLTCEDREEAVERLRARAIQQNRADDAREDVIRRRLEVYDAETRPLLSCYPREAIATINAIGTPAEVLLRILQHLAPLQARRFGNVLEV